MITDIIDQAGQATRDIKTAIADVILRLQTLDTTCNALGVLNDPGMLGAQLDEASRAIDHIQVRRVYTTWPNATHYAEV